MGPPSRSFAADAHDCIMVATLSRVGRIQVRGARSARTMASSPRSVLSQLLTGPESAPILQRMPLCSRPSRASRSAMAFGHPWPPLRAAAYQKAGRDEEMSQPGRTRRSPI